MKINMIIQKLKSNSTTYHINKKKKIIQNLGILIRKFVEGLKAR